MTDLFILKRLFKIKKKKELKKHGNGIQAFMSVLLCSIQLQLFR